MVPAWERDVDVRTVIDPSESTARPPLFCDRQAEGGVSRLCHALWLLNVTLDGWRQESITL